MGKVFGTLRTVAGWCFALFCFTAVLVYGINPGSVLLLLCGIAALPLKGIRNVWEKVPIKLRRWKNVLLGVLFFIAVLMVPSDKVEEANSSGNFEPVTITQATTNTPVPTATNTPVPTATNTPVPTATNTPVPTATNTPVPTVTSTPALTATSTPVPTATNTPVPTATSTPVPTATSTPVAAEILTEAPDITLAEIPAYSGTPYVVVNDNAPFFLEKYLSVESYEYYSELDGLGRCGVTSACIGIDLMPTQERGSIGQVKPTGWHTVKYDVVDGMYLYNRCHLIGFQLTGENANTRNLITGTRYMNVDGMLPFENMVADYVEETGNHVLYRVTPLFDGENLVADGVLMEAKSVEDDGEGILFNVFVYNVQPGIEIDYATGESALAEVVNDEEYIDLDSSDDEEEQEETVSSSVYVWISATGSKYHNKNNCGNMNPNKAYQLELDEAIKRGYDACKKCY